VNFDGPLEWSNEAEIGLSETFNGNSVLTRDRVKSGQYQLWKTENPCGFLVTESFRDLGLFWLICFQGVGALQLWVVLASIVAVQGYTRMGCFTRHKAALRLFRRFRPMISLTADSEYRIEIDVAELLNHETNDKHFKLNRAIRRALDEKSVEPAGRSFATAN
jgi:hypothetical protein